jgi:hypothetical protein
VISFRKRRQQGAVYGKLTLDIKEGSTEDMGHYLGFEGGSSPKGTGKEDF